MKNNIIGLLGLLLLVNCSLMDVMDNKGSEEGTHIDIITIDTNPIKQAEYKESWLALTRAIDVDNPYAGRADIWGGGELALHLWFQDGDLWDYMDNFDPGNHYVLHTLVENSFIDDKTAVMVMAHSASPALSGVLYVVRISNDTIYRTKSMWGFNFTEDWDGKSVDLANLVPIGTKKNI